MPDSPPSPEFNPVQDPNVLLQFEAVLAELREQPEPQKKQEPGGFLTPPQKPNELDVSAVENKQAPANKGFGALPVTRKLEHSINVLDELELVINSPTSNSHSAGLNDQDLHLTQAILEYSRDAIVVLQGMKLLSCNKVAESLFGLDRDSHLGCNFLRLLRENFETKGEQRKLLIRELIRQGVVEQEIRRDGRQDSIWYELRLKEFEQDEQHRTLVLAHDISERKKYEIELSKSRDFLNHTLNAVPEPLSVKSANLEIVLVNDAFCETHDVQREQVLGKTAQDSLPRSYSAEVTQQEQQVLESGEKQAAFEAFIDVNHEQFILSTYRSAFKEQSSGEEFVVAVSRDVTAEMKRENRLQLLASVFENAQEGVAILNPDGTICEANPEFIGTVGKTHASIIDTTLEGLLDCGSHQFSEIISLAQAGRPWFGYVKMLTSREEAIACWLSLSPSKNRRGETTNLIAMFSDITQIENTRRELHRQALHDNLTDLPNRRYYRQRIADLIASDVNGTVRFGVSFLDLDDFKIVNDTLGHDAGDQLLVEASRRVKETLGPDCFMARFGGDEFALLIPEQVDAPLQAVSCAKAVVEALGKPFSLAGHEVHIGVSVGTTVYPDHAMDVESLMRHADVAMYKAKDEGKNKVTFFSSELVEAVEKRQRLLSELRAALEAEELTVVYQPKMCLRTNMIASSEALVRWTKADGTTVSPAEFVPLAEDFGLINLLGHQVLKTVCKQAREWFDAGVLSGPIAVNLSPRQMKEPNFLQQLVDVINEAGIDPTWIELEITENAVMEDVDRALKLMHKINELGVSIAMDDFGTGYSSLSYIRDFPIRTLKIDTTFVRDLPSCSRAVAIAKTVLSLGHGLDLKVVAEGVETAEQLEFLRAADCDIVQGYYISRPLTAEKFLEWLRSL
jgi:diguanylate cyclase (GGDEF)-like protein/PAS domain S-box-containing protein